MNLNEDSRFSIANERARIIADSISEVGARITTIEVKLHRFVLAEFNTHRVFSRNSASSRAIPIHKLIERVNNDPAIPVEWGSNQAGMQAGTLLDHGTADIAKQIWLAARDEAVVRVRMLNKLGVHKQICNRIIEPWLYTYVLVTATEWENFFEQRCSPLAQPEMRVAAEAIYDVYHRSEPKLLMRREWHLPFILEEDSSLTSTEQQMVSVARCARVSYLTHDGIRDYKADLDLFTKLTTARPMHASPLEHVAQPADAPLMAYFNLRGWVSYRYLYEN